MRTEGAASAPAVARAIAFGCGSPASRASANQRLNSTIGSGSTSDSFSGWSVSRTLPGARGSAARLVALQALDRAVSQPASRHPSAVVLRPLGALAPAGRTALQKLLILVDHGRASTGQSGRWIAHPAYQRATARTVPGVPLRN